VIYKHCKLWGSRPLNVFSFLQSLDSTETQSFGFRPCPIRSQNPQGKNQSEGKDLWFQPIFVLRICLQPSFRGEKIKKESKESNQSKQNKRRNPGGLSCSLRSLNHLKPLIYEMVKASSDPLVCLNFSMHKI